MASGEFNFDVYCIASFDAILKTLVRHNIEILLIRTTSNAQGLFFYGVNTSSTIASFIVVPKSNNSMLLNTIARDKVVMVNTSRYKYPLFYLSQLLLKN